MASQNEIRLKFVYNQGLCRISDLQTLQAAPEITKKLLKICRKFNKQNKQQRVILQLLIMSFVYTPMILVGSTQLPPKFRPLGFAVGGLLGFGAVCLYMFAATRWKNMLRKFANKIDQKSAKTVRAKLKYRKIHFCKNGICGFRKKVLEYVSFAKLGSVSEQDLPRSNLTLDRTSASIEPDPDSSECHSRRNPKKPCPTQNCGQFNTVHVLPPKNPAIGVVYGQNSFHPRPLRPVPLRPLQPANANLNGQWTNPGVPNQRNVSFLPNAGFGSKVSPMGAHGPNGLRVIDNNPSNAQNGRLSTKQEFADLTGQGLFAGPVRSSEQDVPFRDQNENYEPQISRLFGVGPGGIGGFNSQNQANAYVHHANYMQSRNGIFGDRNRSNMSIRPDQPVNYTDGKCEIST